MNRNLIIIMRLYYLSYEKQHNILKDILNNLVSLIELNYFLVLVFFV